MPEQDVWSASWNSHTVSVESDPVVGHPSVLGQQKIMGLPKHAAPSSPNPRPWEDCPSSPSPGPNDHPGDTADAMCDAEGWDPGSWPVIAVEEILQKRMKI